MTAYPKGAPRAKITVSAAAALALGLILAPVTAGLTAAPAAAQEQAVAFDLPAGPLSTALRQLAAQAGIQIGFESDLVAGKVTDGFKAALTPRAALDQLLSGSGLTYEFIDARTVSLGPAGAAEGNPVALPKITVHGGSGGKIEANGYVGLSSATGAKTDTPFIETPQSISSVTEAQIEDRNPQSLLDAIAYTPGARVFAYGTDPRYDSFFVRGFNLTNTGVFRDNLRQPTGGYGYFQTEPYGTEGISILRGPSSALYGATGAGGLYNVITKRPTEETFGEVQAQYGTDNRRQAQFDLSGTANEDGSVLYRLTGLGRLADTEYEAVDDNKAFFAPAMTWRDEDTKLTLLSEYSMSDTGGNPAYYNDSYGHVSGFEAGDPAFDDLIHHQGRIGWEFEQEVNERVTLRQNARYSLQDIKAEYVYAYNGPENAANPTLVDRGSGREDQRLGAFVIDNQVQARLSTGALDHTFLTGLDISWADFRNTTGYGAVDALDTSNPNYGQPIVKPDYTSRTDQEQVQAGIYLQDQVRIGEAWTVTLGGRYDWVETETENTSLATGASSSQDQTEREFSGRVGVTYLTGFGIAPYASLSTAFSPNIGVNSTTGSPFEPTTSLQQEVGVKYVSPASDLMATAALFNIDQENGLFYEVVNGVNTQVQRGELRSRGAEFEVNASLGNGLSISASYTYTDLEIIEGTPGTEGNQVSSVPEHMAAAWANYFLPEESGLEGVNLGFGARYVGRSYGDDTNTLTNSQRVLFDAALGFDLAALSPSLEGASFQVNATNLLDRRDTTCTGGYCYLDPGRTVIGTLKYRW